MNRKDVLLVGMIGAAVGLLIQPILTNFTPQLQGLIALSPAILRMLVFAGFFVLAPLALFIASLIGKKLPVIYQFAQFAAVGTLNSFVDLGIFNLETLWYGSQPSGLMFAVMKSASFLIATTNSFVWNKFWTFKSGASRGAGEVVKFYAIAIAGFFLNVGAASLVYGVGGGAASGALWLNIVSPVAGIFAALLWNFFGYKLFVFKQ